MNDNNVDNTKNQFPIVKSIKLHLNMSAERFGTAIDHLFLAVHLNPHQKSENWGEVCRWASSSIVHAYSAFDTMVNAIGHEMYKREDSPLYVPHDDRPYLERKNSNRWENLQVLDKLKFLLDQKPCAAMDDRLLAQLTELNTYRNKLLHGEFYETEFFLTHTSSRVYENGGKKCVQQHYHVAETVCTIDDRKWRSKYSNMKFSRPNEVCYCDAHSALHACFSGLCYMCQHFSQQMRVSWRDRFGKTPNILVIKGHKSSLEEVCNLMGKIEKKAEIAQITEGKMVHASKGKGKRRNKSKKRK